MRECAWDSAAGAHSSRQGAGDEFGVGVDQPGC